MYEYNKLYNRLQSKTFFLVLIHFAIGEVWCSMVRNGALFSKSNQRDRLFTISPYLVIRIGNTTGMKLIVVCRREKNYMKIASLYAFYPLVNAVASRLCIFLGIGSRNGTFLTRKNDDSVDCVITALCNRFSRVS